MKNTSSEKVRYYRYLVDQIPCRNTPNHDIDVYKYKKIINNYTEIGA